jgi:hypothetical protein
MVRQVAFGRWSCTATLWRAISFGVGFALIGLTMIVLAIGAAGIAPVVPHPEGDVPVAAHAGANHRLEIYQDRAEALGAALPVP